MVIASVLILDSSCFNRKVVFTKNGMLKYTYFSKFVALKTVVAMDLSLVFV